MSREFTKVEKNVALDMVKTYNRFAGVANRLGDKPERIQTILDAVARGTDADLKVWIRQYVKETPEADRGMMDCFRKYTGLVKEEVQEQETMTTTTTEGENKMNENKAVVNDNAIQYSMGILEQAVVGLIAKTQSDRIENEIMGQVKDTIRDFIKSEYGTIERRINTVINGEHKELKGIQHEKFERVLQFVANNEPVYLTGPAGSGKNVICKQVAEALGLNFYFTNAVTQEYKLTGFTDAMGNYQPTQFYKAFTEGGVFMLDEMDASIPEVLVILNAAIANKYFDFPAPIGYVEAHPDFRIIAAGNTLGHGADASYVGRNQLDMASLDRFGVIEIDYCKEIEDGVAGGDIELANFCRDFRKAANKAGVQIVVSYRAIGRLAKMVQLMSVREALETCLLKGMEKDSVNMIYTGIGRDSKYRDALREIVAA